MKFERITEAAVHLYGTECLTNHDLYLPTIKLFFTQNVHFFTNALVYRPRKDVPCEVHRYRILSFSAYCLIPLHRPLSYVYLSKRHVVMDVYHMVDSAKIGAEWLDD
jgi:hypothetical protein